LAEPIPNGNVEKIVLEILGVSLEKVPVALSCLGRAPLTIPSVPGKDSKEEEICHGRDHSIDPRLDTIQIHAFEPGRD
jgi:hypothetical protein